MRRLAWLVWMLAPAVGAGCVGPGQSFGPTPEEVAPPLPEPVVGRVTDHAILISLDGLRPEAIARFPAHTLRRLLREGSYTLEAQTVVPSRTLPGHKSMISGLHPADHGIDFNDDPPDTRWSTDVPTIFSLSHRAGLLTAAFSGKEKFRQLYDSTAVAHAEEPHNLLDRRFAWQTARRVAAHIREERPNLIFVHFSEPDMIGHLTGWMSPPYGWSVWWTDRQIARVLAAADEVFGVGGYTVIVSSDHGGHRFTHGSADPVDTTIPWIAWGRGVRPGHPLPAGIHTVDTAATMLWLLGQETPPDWAGRPVAEAFEVGASRRGQR